MSVELANENAVVVAKHFNPSIVNALWLVDNEITTREDIRAGCVFTEVMANVLTRRFNLFVAPPQLQFVPLGDEDTHQNTILECLWKLIELLPHTPYTAMGINFTWHVTPEAHDAGTYSRHLFFREGQALSRAFDTEDARFGAYFSKAALGCRLKLDIKPISKTHGDERTELMQLAFNFHLDLAGERPVDQIHSLLQRWDEAKQLTASILNAVETEGD